MARPKTYSVALYIKAKDWGWPPCSSGRCVSHVYYKASIWQSWYMVIVNDLVVYVLNGTISKVH